MSACSAACTAPITRPARARRRASDVERHGVPARAGRELPGREVERHDLEHLVGRRAPALVRDEVVLHASPRRGARRRRPTGADCSVGDDRDVGLLARSGCARRRRRPDRAPRRGARCRGRARGTGGPGAGRWRPGARRGTRATRRPCPRAGRRCRPAGTRPTNRVRSPTRAAGGSRPAQNMRSPRGLSWSSSTRSRTASSSASPK